MSHETSDEMIPGHSRQLVVSAESGSESTGRQSTLEDESPRAAPGYDGFEDLADDTAGTAEEY